ncbi:MAG TPA: DUF5000 domain-containing lipoprotein [Parapedobacter sp.]|uniref:DUF5000 domain-containing lipoprotein n=1 Tax=Parapedobacter sp. TaxID=1958893 RepID=UPI002C0E0BE6|nr:DUF5000 domain-containing lipoprotein [Parapedobacter sp.]HWK57716.1 DUF5000 domain-containing lipoprotein [Parapedobacter sp.]
MKKITNILAICCCILAIASCKQEEKHTPHEQDGWVPDPVGQISVENLPGGAKLTYTLPDNPELLYVKAEFETQGQLRTAKATYYNNTLLLEGFGDTLHHDVKVYAVSRSEVHSDPVVVTVKPLKPPLITTFESLTLKEDFGGATVDFSNLSKADLAIAIIYQDEEGFWANDETLYTMQESGAFSARGFAARPTVFGVYVEDRWGNFSDTLVAELTPFFEEIIPKPFETLVLPTDNTTLYSAADHMGNLWDGGEAHYQTSYAAGVPTWFTFDLKATCKLSRFLYQQRTNSVVVRWGNGNPRYFEVWGTADTPNPDGSWEGWTKLMDVESIKPSGLPLGQYSDEDWELALRGEEFNFPLDAPPVRYIRIKVNETWGLATGIHIKELTFWGQIL